LIYMVLLVLRMDSIIRMSPNLFLLSKVTATASSGKNLTTRGLRSTREWFRNFTNLDRTISALSTLSSDFTDASYNRTVIAIELINEPFPQSPDEVGFLRDFYQRAYGAVREASKDTDMVVALDAAFQGLGVWEGFMTPPDFYEVAMDTVRDVRRREAESGD
jgi:glucan 1,3-beta-glucosidase